MSQIAYFVHDINDAAVFKRVIMMQAAGAQVHVIGFARDNRRPANINGAPVTVVGETRDAAMAQRAVAVLRNLVLPAKIRRLAQGCDVVIGRNLEGLAMAWRARQGRGDARLIYECLDIHRMLLGSSLPCRAVQGAEAALIRKCDLLLTSSPAFLREYFSRYGADLPPSYLVENKVLMLDREIPAPSVPAPGPPWTIGWFGNLRCRRSFGILTRLAAEMKGNVKVLFAGRPSPAVFEDFAGEAAAAPYCEFRGSYTPADLPSLYGECHFAWSIDFYEEGLNSSWLLPNRIYEAATYDVVPIALAQVETGRWLHNHQVGVVMEEDSGAQLHQMLSALDSGSYADMRHAVTNMPRKAVVADREECLELMQAIEGSSRRT